MYSPNGLINVNAIIFNQHVPSWSSTHYLQYIEQVGHLQLTSFFTNLGTSNDTNFYQQSHTPENPLFSAPR